MGVKFSDTAKSDIREILDYGRHHFGRAEAEHFIDSLIDQTYILDDFPDIGALFQGDDNAPDNEIRQYPFKQYILLYRRHDGDVFVETIIPKGRPREE